MKIKVIGYGYNRTNVFKHMCYEFCCGLILALIVFKILDILLTPLIVRG